MIDPLRLGAGQLLEHARALVHANRGDRPLAFEPQHGNLLATRGRFAYRFARLLHPKEMAKQQRELAQLCLHSVLRESIDRLSPDVRTCKMSDAMRANIHAIFSEVEQRLTSELTGERALTAKSMVSILSFADDRIAAFQGHDSDSVVPSQLDRDPPYDEIESVKKNLLSKLDEPINFALIATDHPVDHRTYNKAQALEFLHGQINRAFRGEIAWSQECFDRYNQLRGEIEDSSLQLSLLVDGLAESTQDLSQGLNEGARPTGRIESNLWDLEVQVSDWIYSFRTSASQEAKPLYRAASQMCFVLREVNLYELDPNADPMKRKEALAIKGNVERMYQSLVEQRYAPLQQQLENPSLVQWQDVVASLRQLAPSIATKAMMQRLDAVELKEVAGPGGQMGRREPVRKVRVNRSAPEDGVEQRRQTRLPTDSSSRSPSKKILRFSDQSDAAEFRVRDASANRPSALGASIRRLQEARLSLPQHDHVQVLEQWKIDQTSFKAEGDEPGLGDRLWNNWENLPHPLTGERGKRSYVNLVLADYYNHRDLGARQHELLRNQLLNRRKLRTDAVVWQVPIQPPLSLMRSASRRELPGSSLEQSSGSELEHSSELLHDTQGSAGPSQPKQIPSVQTQARLTKLAKKFLQGDFMATAKPGTNLRGLQIQVEIIAKFLAKGGEHNEALRTNTEELRGKLSDRLQKLGFAVEARIRHKTDKREEDRRREYETLAASIVDLKAKIRSFDIDIATTTS